MGSVTTTTADDRALFERSGDAFTRLVHDVPEHAWAAATPCSEWDVRSLVNHVVAEHLWAPDLLGGATVEEIGSRYDGDVIGDDPVGAWDSAWAASRAAFGAADEDDTVSLSRGPTPLAQYRVEMLMDLVVHGWDLARGAGLPPVQDDEAARRVLAEIQTWGDLAATGVFDQAVPVESEDPLVQLVAALGRQP